MSNSPGIWQAARASSKKSPKNDLGFLTHLTSHAAERQGKVKCSSRPAPNPGSAHIPVQRATPSSPLAPGHHRPRVRTSSAAGTTPRRTRSSKQPCFPGSFLNACHKLNFDLRPLPGGSKWVKRRHQTHEHVRAFGNAEGDPFKAASATQELDLPAREIKGC